MSYQLVRQLQEEAIPVQHSCRVLCVSRSGYYAAQRRSAKPVLCKASAHLWAMAPNMPAELVCAALSMAIQQRQPAPGLIVHSDRGSQYASKLHQDLLDEHGFVCRMSRKGNCWDNSVAERFFLNLKVERVWQRQYANHAEAKADITDYIVGFYNCKRLNSVLGNLPPAAYERKMAEKEPIVVSEIT